MNSAVSIVKCKSYDQSEVEDSIRHCVDLLGGMERFVKPGQRVLLKPNLLYGKEPEKAVNTHPSVLEAVIRLVREARAIPYIGDSPSFGSCARAAEKAGLKRVAEEMGCSLVEFDHPVVPPRRRGHFFKQWEIDRAVLEADAIINLPKWKTHVQMLLTLGVKNLFGCVPGPRKALWHLKAGEDRNLFAKMLVDLYQIVDPSLTILDGVVAMEGDGPGSGNPRLVGLILASEDALSLDQIVCDLIGISRKALPTNRVALKAGLGSEKIEILGERVEEVRMDGFRLPVLTDLGWHLPGFLKRALKNALSSRPVIQGSLCKDCRQCEEICPPGALKRTRKGAAFDYSNCIRCFCCLEVCPEGAITVEPGWAQKLVTPKGKWIVTKD